MKRIKSGSLNQKLLDAIKKAGGIYAEEAKKRYTKGETKNRYRSDPFVSSPEHHAPFNTGGYVHGRTADELHIDDPIDHFHTSGFKSSFYEWFTMYGNPYGHFTDKTYKAEKRHSQSLLTMYGWTGIWNSLNTVQKIKVFRSVYNAENASIIDYDE